MGTIAQEITRIEGAKADLKTAIEAKGVTVPSATLIDGYAALVASIPSGGGGGTKILVSPDVSDYSGGTEFNGVGQITSVNFPSGITSIGEYSFYRCSGLTSVTIPNTVTEIKGYTFRDCTSLASVSFGNGLSFIRTYAFYGCTNLTSITIPNSVTRIESYAFSNVTSINISDLVAWCNIVKKNVWISGNYTLYLNGAAVTDLTIPSSVTSIGDNAFSECSGLTSVTIPSTVTSIGRFAFRNCTSLASVTIPSSVTRIDNYAFTGTAISSIITDSISGYCAITTPGDGWINHDYNLYEGNVLVQSITIPNTITSIPAYKFDRCTSLASVTIPSSVTRIDNYAFTGTAISSIITDSISGYCAITTPGDGWINHDYNLYEGNVLVQSITIPNTITSIPAYKFNRCTSLASVTIPSSVTEIKPYAFTNCPNLASVTCLGTTPPDIKTWYSYFDTSNLTIYVPAESVETYKTTGGWTNYASKIQPIPSE